MTTEQDPRPLDAVDGDAPEALTRALRALGRQRPSDAFLHAAALRLDARLKPAPRGAFETVKGWAGPSPKLLAGKLIAAALVLGGATLAVRSASPATPQATAAGVAGPAELTPAQMRPNETVSEAVPRPVETIPSALPRADKPSVPAATIASAHHEAGLPGSAARVTNRSSASPRARTAQRRSAQAVRPAAGTLSVRTPETPTASLNPEQPASPPRPAPPAAAATAGRPANESDQPPTPPVMRGPAQPSEVELLLDAKRRASGDPEGTLRVVAEHARRFPDGTLAPEREVLAIEALRALGKDAEAEQRFLRFRARFPSSIHVRGLSSELR